MFISLFIKSLQQCRVKRNPPREVVYAYDPRSGKLKLEDYEFEASLGYTASSRPVANK